MDHFVVAPLKIDQRNLWGQREPFLFFPADLKRETPIAFHSDLNSFSAMEAQIISL
ncbi:hypothetical protein GGQ60_001487 [Pedobacter zeae]|uniref:Uncharacterized protein n=1 Tax=Pedobacter zeae TaxID=1737356 RepID=A0A7W6KAV6_9SPHI|nr:hypothetical protein [Pedobacter zeae]